MKPRSSRPRNHALTLVEVLVVMAVLAVLAVVLLPNTAFNSGERRKATIITCVNNLKQVGLSYRIWAGDHDGKYPMEISVTDGGTMGMALTGNVVATFQIMSHELNVPKILWCPTDTGRTIAANFTTDFNNSKISYFVGLSADTNHPQAFLSGDGHFEIGGAPVQSGLLELSTNKPAAWTAARHKSLGKNYGNVGLADGSVQTFSTIGLKTALAQFTPATNRLALP